jgi:hypothetical protein
MGTHLLSSEQIDIIARACHEANRAWCLAHGDTSQKAYDDADEWQRTSAIRGVAFALDGNGPRAQHEAWTADKLADGWVYGTVKDAVAKTHHCLVDYDLLPVEQRAKDSIFLAVVAGFVQAFEAMSTDTGATPK